MVDANKLKVMLKYADGFIMSKCQMRTSDGLIGWQFAKSRAPSTGVEASSQIFADHGYEVVEWDDDQEAGDGTFIVNREDYEIDT